MSDFNLIDIVNLIRAEIRKTQVGPVKKIQGPAGEQGPQGEAGIQGPQGPRGNDGAPGPMGPKGNQGKKGDKGVKGDDGKDGVGIARVEQDIDNAIVVYLTDGNFYTIEMPLIDADGNLGKEIHYKVGGSGGSGGSEGTVDLSGYVRRPSATLNGPSWLVYRENGGAREWAPVTTDLVSTNPDVTFRDAKGRFRSTKDLEDLTNQLKVNRFLANELELINEAIANLAAGSVVVSDDPPNIEADGQLWLDSNRLELFISYEDGWISTTPLAARVEQGEAVQAAIIEALDDGMREQTRLRSRIGDLESNSATKSDLDTKLGNSGEQMLAEGFWRVKQPNSNGGKSTFININDNVMHLYHVAYPESPEHAANMQYVDDQIAAIPAPESSSPAPLLWKYNSSVPADNLGNGEFNLSSSPTHGGAGDWYIYFSNRDARGQMWFPSDGGNSYTHEVGDHLATIRDRDAICCHGKTQKWYFNEGTNNYVRLKLSYYRKQFSLANGKYYLITVPGYMPFFPYSADAYSNGTHS